MCQLNLARQTRHCHGDSNLAVASRPVRLGPYARSVRIVEGLGDDVVRERLGFAHADKHDTVDDDQAFENPKAPFAISASKSMTPLRSPRKFNIFLTQSPFSGRRRRRSPRSPIAVRSSSAFVLTA